MRDSASIAQLLEAVKGLSRHILDEEKQLPQRDKYRRLRYSTIPIDNIQQLCSSAIAR